VTLSLQASGTATVTIADDASTTASSTQEFVDAFNEIVKFVAENDLVTVEDGGQNALFGPLASTSLDEGLISSLRGSLSSASITGGLFNTLADLGISTERDGTLNFDSVKFQQAVGQDPESVRSIARNLGDTLASVGGTIAQYSGFNGLIDTLERSNQTQIDRYNDNIASLEKVLAQQENSLKSQYARLESVIGKMNSQQSALSGLL
jgi:flagellar hook-associated protein 2